MVDRNIYSFINYFIMRIYQKDLLNEMCYPIGKYVMANLVVINHMAAIIQHKYTNKYINIWCRGSSGSIVAAIIASQLQNITFRIVYVPKENEVKHQIDRPNLDSTTINIIVDDFVASGQTIKSIVEDARYHDVKNFDLLLVSGFVDRKTIQNLPIKYVYCHRH